MGCFKLIHTLHTTILTLVHFTCSIASNLSQWSSPILNIFFVLQCNVAATC